MCLIGARQSSVDLIVRESLEFAGCVAEKAPAGPSLWPHAPISIATATSRTGHLVGPAKRACRPSPTATWRSATFTCASHHPALTARGPSSRPPRASSRTTAPPRRTRTCRPGWISSPDAPPDGRHGHRSARPGCTSILEALRRPVNLLIALGFDQDPARLGPLPPHVRVQPTLPQVALLPRCAAGVRTASSPLEVELAEASSGSSADPAISTAQSRCQPSVVPVIWSSGSTRRSAQPCRRCWPSLLPRARRPCATKPVRCRGRRGR